MDGIFIPAPLSNLEAIVKELAPVIDASARKKIESDIVAFHALNATEAKKAEDARALIKQYQDILAETKHVSEQNKVDAAKIVQDKLKADAEIKSGYEKLKEKEDALSTASKDAMKLHDEAIAKLNEAKAKEDAVRIEKSEHAIAVKKHQEDVSALKIERDKIEEFRDEVLTLDAQTKAKVEALKKFNF